MNVEQTMQQVELAQQNVEVIEKQLFTVVKKDLLIEGEIYKNPNESFAYYKEKGGECLGVRGSRFVPNQPKDIFNVIQNIALEYPDVMDLSTLTFKEFYGGSVIEFNQPLDKVKFTNRLGIEEVLDTSFAFRTSYNGMLSNHIKLFVKRLVCSNGMTAIRVGARNIFRNTVNANKDSLYQLRQFARIINDKEDYIHQLQLLDEKDIEAEQVTAFINELINFNPESKNSTRKTNIHKKISDSVEYEMMRTGNSMYGFLQGITYYTNNIVNKDEAYVLFKGGNKMNNKAQELVFAELN